MTNRPAFTTNGIEHVSCPVCEMDNHVTWMEDGKPTRYVRCRTCGTIYGCPRASQKIRYEWLNSTFGYGESAFQISEGRKAALAQEAAILKNHITKGRLLDIGCDLGDLFRWFPNPSWQRFGAELLPSAANYASKTYNAQVFAGTVQQANFPDAFFDLVTMIDMLYYVDDPRSDLQEVKRITKPGGLLAIELAGQSYQLLRSRGLLCWLLDHHWTRLSTDSSYLYWFSPYGLEKLLNRCGFRATSVYIVGSPTSPKFFHNYLAGTYRTLISATFHVSHRLLTWAPKYLLIAESEA